MVQCAPAFNYAFGLYADIYTDKLYDEFDGINSALGVLPALMILRNR
jgi:hypothetical protein